MEDKPEICPTLVYKLYNHLVARLFTKCMHTRLNAAAAAATPRPQSGGVCGGGGSGGGACGAGATQSSSLSVVPVVGMGKHRVFARLHVIYESRHSVYSRFRMSGKRAHQAPLLSSVRLCLTLLGRLAAALSSCATHVTISPPGNSES